MGVGFSASEFSLCLCDWSGAAGPPAGMRCIWSLVAFLFFFLVNKLSHSVALPDVYYHGPTALHRLSLLRLLLRCHPPLRPRLSADEALSRFTAAHHRSVAAIIGDIVATRSTTLYP
jgi:hypothetical protein